MQKDSLLINNKEFKNVPSLGGEYLVSDDGQVYSTKRKSIITGSRVNGYQGVFATRNVTSYIHRMVGEAWIPIPQTYIDQGYTIDTIDHINKDRQDNRIENLRWLPLSKNVKYGVSKPVMRMSDNEEEMLFTSTWNAAEWIISQGLSNAN